MIGWTTKPLGELCEVLDRYRKPITKSDRREGPYPYYGAMGIVDYVDGYLFDEPLILLGEDGAKWGSGEPCAFKAAGKYWVNNHAHIMRPDRSQVLDDWLVYYLCGTDLLPFITGLTVPKLNQERMREIPIPVPPLEQQRRIVAVLDEAFAAIATATANAEKNLANTRELFEASVRDTFADPDRSWELMTLKEAARDFGRGKSKHRPRNDPNLYGGDYPFIQTGDVRNSDHLITQYSQTYSEAGLAQSKLWPRGTICITIAANIAETGILDFDACFPDSVIGMVVDPARTSNSYVEYLLQSLKAVLQAKGKGSAQANINLATFENERFPFPPKAVQLDIVARLGALSEQVQVMEALYGDKLRALDGLKQSLLHRAFTGDLTAAMPETIAA